MKKYLISSLLALLLSGCGGGSNSDSNIITTTFLDLEEENIEYPITPVGTSTDYSAYAWSIKDTSELTNALSRYSIDSNANINMPSTIPTPLNGEKIKVAVIDQGFQYNHPDFADKVINVTYVNSSNLENGTHGTSVAGVIASTYLGVAPDNIELVLINVNFDEVTEAELIAAFYYSVEEENVQIINCSWGTDPFDENSYGFSTLYTNALLDLKNNYNVNVVFAAGNESTNLDNGVTTDSELDSVLGVGATNIYNELTSYSNYGTDIDIYAPGGDSNLQILTTDAIGVLGENTFSPNNNYAYVSGTSFAAPTISGVIALMLSKNPNLTPEKIKTLLISYSDSITGSYAKVNVSNTLDAIP